MTLTAADYAEICQLLDRYGHIVDDRAWHQMKEIFTEDLEFIPSTGPEHTTTSLAALIARWSQEGFHHPVGHHSTNVVIESLGPDRARSRCKGLAVEEDGRVWSLVYEDELIRTPAGWRSFRRVPKPRPTSARPV